MNPAQVLFHEVETTRPDIYQTILQILRPHSVEATIRLLNNHLRDNVSDLSIFNRHRDNIANFLLHYVTLCKKNFPQPGEPYGIQLACRISRADTQQALDSKHLKTKGFKFTNEYNVVRKLKYEIEIFSSQSQIFELAPKRTYSSIYVKNYTIKKLMSIIPDCCHLKRNEAYNKGRNSRGKSRYLSTFEYILVQEKDVIKVIYTNSKQFNYLMRCLDLTKIILFTDYKKVFQNCGIINHLFNMIRIIKFQNFSNETDVLTVAKYQTRTGTPLPVNRVGLANDENKSPFDVLVFEALKKNSVNFGIKYSGKEFPIESSTDKIVAGQQFNEGTGYMFGLLPYKTR